MILAVNTCEPRGQLALLQNNKIIEILEWEGRGSHSEVLPLEFSNWINENKINLNNLDSLLCVTGPGSFTGVRVGVSFCRSLAYSLKIPVIDLNSLGLLALNTQNETLPVMSVLDAQKNSLFVSQFSWKSEQLVGLKTNAVVPIRELANFVTTPHQVIGSAFSRYKEFIGDSEKLVPFLGEQRTDLKAVDNFPAFVKSLTSKSWNELTPVYIKASAAEEKHKR